MSAQNIEHFSVMRSRKRSEVEAWRDEDPKAKESKKRRRTSSVSQSITATKPTSTPQSSRTPSGHTSAKQGTPLWRKSENAQIGISPYASPQTDAAPVKTIESDHVQPASRVRRAEVEDVEDVKPLSVASAVPHHLRQRKEMGSLGMGSPQCRPSTSAVPLVYKNASPTSSTSARSLSRHLPSQLLKPFKPPGRKMEP